MLKTSFRDGLASVLLVGCDASLAASLLHVGKDAFRPFDALDAGEVAQDGKDHDVVHRQAPWVEAWRGTFLVGSAQLVLTEEHLVKLLEQRRQALEPHVGLSLGRLDVNTHLLVAPQGIVDVALIRPIGNWHLDEPRFEQRTSDCVHPREPVLNLLTASRRRDLAIHGDASSEGADIQRLRKPSLEHLRAVMYPLGRRDTGACTR
mmetsp:Transcript_21571/g.65477  ORF Transcript_21571/g.65477 Transcript_21571/m.65477 type:complete len:205 (-) Transcript_21571:2-616(-)